MGWRFFLFSAQSALTDGDLKVAEQNYIQALKSAESDCSQDIGMAVVLMELAEFYADNGQRERAQVLRGRVRELLAVSLDHIAPHTSATVSSV